jgi:hypothetical protein
MGRDRKGRFTAGYSPDRGRGPRRGFRLRPSDSDLRRVVLEVANTIVSVPRGKGRERVTLFEALILRLASGPVRRRAAVMDFIRLVFESAGAPVIAGATASLQQELADIRRVAIALAATDVEQSAAHLSKEVSGLLGGKRN